MSVTWNPLDKGINCSLSAGDLTTTFSGASAQMVRATASKSSGKWYWEVHFDSGSFGIIPGIALSTAALSYVGADSNGWGYYSLDGRKYTNAASAAYGVIWAAGDTIGVALDLDVGTVSFLKNNSSQGVAFSNLTGNVFPAISGDFNAGLVATSNFGATAFAYSPPSGYSKFDLILPVLMHQYRQRRN